MPLLKDKRIEIRITLDDFEKISAMAIVAGLTLSEYVRNTALLQDIKKPISFYDAQVVTELRKIGGLLKMLYTDGHITDTDPINELQRFIKKLREGKPYDCQKNNSK